MGRRKIRPFHAELEIVDTATDGRGIARHDNRVVFVTGGVPGDILQTYIHKKEKKSLVGKIESVVQSSPLRTTPVCQHFGICGGCKWQMMAYSAQLTYKHKQVTDALARIAKVDIGEILPIVPSPNPYFHRNKLEFTFSNKAWLTQEQIQSDSVFDQRVLGFHVPKFFDKIIDIQTCHLQLPIINDIRNTIRDFAREQAIPFYDIRTHEGFLRNLIFRTSAATGEIMLILIVASENRQWIDQILALVQEKFPSINHILWIVNTKFNSSYSDLPFSVWKGEPYLTEKLGDYHFHIGPTSFFQTNPLQAKRLYQVVYDWLKEVSVAEIAPLQTVYDLYTGTGSIGIFVSELAQKIVGLEYVPAAIDDAWRNVKLNHLEDKFSFYAGDIKNLLTDELLQKEGSPDVVITDPPRQGMEPTVVERLIELAPHQIIYVSCKPATQARDIQLLSEQYEVLRIQPVDMFPQTVHVENVALLKKKST